MHIFLDLIVNCVFWFDNCVFRRKFFDKHLDEEDKHGDDWYKQHARVNQVCPAKIVVENVKQLGVEKVDDSNAGIFRNCP